MAETTPEVSSSRVTDETFMMECFRHIQNPVVVDVSGVAKALNYTNPVSVSNRLSRLKKKFNLRVSSTTGPVPVGDEADISAAVAGATPKSTPRKGARVAKGPIKAKAPTDGEEPNDGSPVKPARKAGGGRKRKTAATPAPVEEQTENGEATENGASHIKDEGAIVKPEASDA
ncbi:predicted protein [Uncinocarpus reesii 1704]|uniref:Myb-like DNA-binding domain-containing protein n=1 Tax=Uncinocarpus reesii (strain UAMH 1704) TaxID=336963 RepID=C4JMR8_UNCRE|nr:uncharacterized protein UREG_04126 [Uncinocarpus reesii 1704]EEP79280.1 predicted protein [Uncinocarpus reesii 1704]